MEKLRDQWDVQKLYTVFSASVCPDSHCFEKFVNFFGGNVSHEYSDFELEYLNDVKETVGEVNLALTNFYDVHISELETLAMSCQMAAEVCKLAGEKYAGVIDLKPSFGNAEKLKALGLNYYTKLNAPVEGNFLYVISLKQCDDLMLYIKDITSDMMVIVPSAYLDSIKSQNFHKFLGEREYISHVMKAKDCLGVNSKNTFTLFYMGTTLDVEKDTENIVYFDKEDLEILPEYNMNLPRFSETGELGDSTIKVPVNYLGFMKNNFKTKLKADISSYPQGYSLTITRDNLEVMAEYYTMLNLKGLDTSKRIPRFAGDKANEFKYASVVYMMLNNSGIVNYSMDFMNRLRFMELDSVEEPYPVFYLESYLKGLDVEVFGRDFIPKTMGVIQKLHDALKKYVNETRELSLTDIQILGFTDLYELLEMEDDLEKDIEKIESELKVLCNP